jgi:hypothetical protein
LKLKTGEIAVIRVVPENFSFVTRVKYKVFIAQATPFEAYYSQNEMTEHASFVVIPDCLNMTL